MPLLTKSFKKSLLYCLLCFMAMLLFMLPLIWLNVEHPLQFQKVYHRISDHKLFFTIVRWIMIALIFLVWSHGITLWSNKQQWTEERIVFWRKQRCSVCLWLIALELLCCENFLMKLIELGTS